MYRLLQRFDDRLSPSLRRRAGRAHDTTSSAMMRIALSITLAMLTLSFIGTAAAAGPSLKVIGPTEDAVIQGTDVTVQFETTNITIVPSTVPVAEMGKHPELNRPDQGHVHLSLD